MGAYQLLLLRSVPSSVWSLVCIRPCALRRCSPLKHSEREPDLFSVN
jgi:hypothetical protein